MTNNNDNTNYLSSPITTTTTIPSEREEEEEQTIENNNLYNNIINNNLNNNINNNLNNFTTYYTKIKTKIKPFASQLLGILCILSVVILWILGGEAIQFIYGNLNYDKPLFVTWISTNLFSIYCFGFLFIKEWRLQFLSNSFWCFKGLILWFCNDCCNENLYENTRSFFKRYKYLFKNKNNLQNLQNLEEEEEIVFNNSINNNNTNHKLEENEILQKEEEEITINKEQQELNETIIKENEEELKEEEQDDSISVSKTFKLSIAVTFFWFFANVTYNYALSYTSVASDTIISNSSCLFTFLFSLIIGVEKHFSFLRLFAIILSLSGVILVTYSDSKNSNNGNKDSVFGNFLSLISAVFYGVYSSIIKKFEKNVSMAMMFGFVGIINFVVHWPLIFIFWGFGIEKFEMPSFKIFASIVISSLVTAVFSDLLWALSVILTSPVIATVGLSLTIPFAIFCDFIFHGNTNAFNLMYSSGTIFVIFGFIAVNLSYYLPEKIKRFDQPFFCR